MVKKIEVSLTDVKLFCSEDGVWTIETPTKTIKLKELKTQKVEELNMKEEKYIEGDVLKFIGKRVNGNSVKELIEKAKINDNECIMVYDSETNQYIQYDNSNLEDYRC